MAAGVTSIASTRMFPIARSETTMASVIRPSRRRSRTKTGYRIASAISRSKATSDSSFWKSTMAPTATAVAAPARTRSVRDTPRMFPKRSSATSFW